VSPSNCASVSQVAQGTVAQSNCLVAHVQSWLCQVALVMIGVLDTGGSLDWNFYTGDRVVNIKERVQCESTLTN